MGTMTVLAQREIAVHTGKPILVFREPFFDKANVKTTPSFLRAIFSSATVDVVNREKLKVSISATKALSAVGIYNNLLLFAIVVFQPLIVHSASPLEILPNLFLVSVAIALASAKLFFTLLLVARSTPLKDSLFVLFVVVLLLGPFVLGMGFVPALTVGLSPLGIFFFPFSRISDAFLSVSFVIASGTLLAAHYCLRRVRVFVGHEHIVEHALQENKETVYGISNWNWRGDTARAAREYRRIILGGSRQQCRDEKFSLIDLDAAMQTGRKASNGHRERLSERTPLVGGAIVWASGNLNRKRAAEMTAPCFA